MKLLKIISGGQTGVDKTALVRAMEMGIATGGWVPKGCRTESGIDLSLVEVYGCTETENTDYKPRTYRNVRESDVTVWFGTTSSPGFNCTRRAWEAYKKPRRVNPTPEEFRIICEISEVVNVAGNRESVNPNAILLVNDAFEAIKVMVSAARMMVKHDKSLRGLSS